jgi:hypothetical protein
VQEKGLTTYNEVATLRSPRARSPTATPLMASILGPAQVSDEVMVEHEHVLREQGDSLDQSERNNIRRRVYDALNVLLALNIISKEGKKKVRQRADIVRASAHHPTPGPLTRPPCQIKWIGLPENSAQEVGALHGQQRRKLEQIAKLKIHLNDLMLQARSRRARGELRRPAAPHDIYVCVACGV